MRYFGSKTTLLDVVWEIISERIETGTLCDPFGGIGTVGSVMRARGYDVWSGDILTFAHYFQIAKIKYPHRAYFNTVLYKLKLNNICEINLHMNSLAPCRGWFVTEYSEKRLFFTRDNAMKIEACRKEIVLWEKDGLLNNDEKAILLAGLIDSMDKVANTAGTYYAFLKNWHRKAVKPFKFELIMPQQSGSDGVCCFESAEILLGRKKFDIIYLDPPYNERSYAHYYHLPETIARCACPAVHGKSGIPNTELPYSSFNKTKQARISLEKLVDKARFKLLVFHYAENGLISPPEIRKILSQYGNMEILNVDSKGYYTGRGSKISAHQIYMVTNA